MSLRSRSIGVTLGLSGVTEPRRMNPLRWCASVLALAGCVAAISACGSGGSSPVADATPVCGAGTELRGTQCVAASVDAAVQDAPGIACGPGTYLDGGACLAIVVDADVVTCGAGTYLDGGACVAIPLDASTTTCGAGTYLEGGVCTIDEGGTAEVVTIDPSAGTQDVPLGSTGSMLHVPTVALTAPVTLTIATRELAPADAVVPATDPAFGGAALHPQILEIVQAGAFAAPVFLEQQIPFPVVFQDLPAGQRVAVPYPSFSRADGSQPWSRDDLATTPGVAGDATAVLVIDTTKSPPRASVLMALDHFTQRTFPIPDLVDPSWGWGAMFQPYQAGNVTLLVPGALYANSVLQLATLESEFVRQNLYTAILVELVEQTERVRAKLVGDVAQLVAGMTNSTCPACTSAERVGREMEALTAFRDQIDAVTPYTDVLTSFADDFGKVRIAVSASSVSTFLDWKDCITGGPLQVLLLQSLDQIQARHRWAAIRPNVIGSPLYAQDPAFRAAVAAAELQIGDFAAKRLGATLGATATHWLDGTAQGCSAVMTNTLGGLVTDAVLKATVAELGGASSLAGGGFAAIGGYLVLDYGTNDVIKATANAQRVALLGTVLRFGGLEHNTSTVPNGVRGGVKVVAVPERIAPFAPSADDWYRIQVTYYGYGAIEKTAADIVSLGDLSLLSTWFTAWGDIFLQQGGVKADRKQVEAALLLYRDQYLAIAGAVDLAFASCVGTDCQGSCNDTDHDGFGTGAGCLGPDCDDGNAALHVGCATCADHDHDGFGTGTGCLGPDCDDGNPLLAASCSADAGIDAPAEAGCMATGPETCANVGVDNDCDGDAAELRDGVHDGDACATGLAGICAAGVQHCQGGSLSCASAATSRTEVCNNLDDDCDGQVDNGAPPGGSCVTGLLGVCANGHLSCGAGSYSVCIEDTASGPEACNLLDDDCNGQVDEGLGSKTCGLGVCFVTVSSCVGGVLQSCTPGQAAASEVCINGLDDDCNGQVDEGCACTSGQAAGCYSGPAGTEGVGVCKAGSHTCVGGQFGACSGETGPSTETCDGQDNNCDGETDEGLALATCGSGACARTGATCAASSCIAGDATAEVCDGIDNDCDGAADNGLALAVCGLGVCARTGTTCAPSSCAAGSGTTEVCDGIDNDCDGTVDNPGVCTCGDTLCTASAGETQATCCPDCGCPATLECIVGTCKVPSVIQIEAGGQHTCVLFDDGKMTCWGRDNKGQIGDGSSGTTSFKPTPTPVVGIAGATQIALGATHTCALLLDQTVRCWGENVAGQLGNGTTTFSVTPVTPLGLGPAVQIVAGGDHTCARLQTGAVACWGNNGGGELGTGAAGGYQTVPQMLSLSNVRDVGVGDSHTCAALSDGTVACWGSNASGQVVGDGFEGGTHASPAAVKGVAGMSIVALGGGVSCSAPAAGSPTCWGDDWYGQLGDGTTKQGLGATVAAIGNLQGFGALSWGLAHACGIDASGVVKCWGANGKGQLGDGSTVEAHAPKTVFGLGPGELVAAGGSVSGVSHSCAVLADGSVYCWGSALYGQVGDGTTGDANNRVVLPVLITVR